MTEAKHCCPVSHSESTPSGQGLEQVAPACSHEVPHLFTAGYVEHTNHNVPSRCEVVPHQLVGLEGAPQEFHAMPAFALKLEVLASEWKVLRSEREGNEGTMGTLILAEQGGGRG